MKIFGGRQFESIFEPEMRLSFIQLSVVLYVYYTINRGKLPFINEKNVDKKVMGVFSWIQAHLHDWICFDYRFRFNQFGSVLIRQKVTLFEICPFIDTEFYGIIELGFASRNRFLFGGWYGKR